MEMTALTLRVRHMLDYIAVFDNLDHAADESLCSLRGVVDCDERVWALGSGGHCGQGRTRWDK